MRSVCNAAQVEGVEAIRAEVARKVDADTVHGMLNRKADASQVVNGRQGLMGGGKGDREEDEIEDKRNGGKE